VSELVALPFDQYPRYRLVSELLLAAAGEPRQLSVLDVGGCRGALARFLPLAWVAVADLEAGDDRRRAVIADGAALPFRDASFDAVVAVDTLEHVPPAHRRAFVAECARVARRWVLLVGPYAAPRVVEAEALLARFLGQGLGLDHRFLEEHLRHGLPDRYATQRQLDGLGARTMVAGHGQLERWLCAMALELYADSQPLLRPLLDGFRRFYNASLFEADGAPPHYRHALVAALGDAPLPPRREPPAVCVPSDEAEAAIGSFLRHALAFERERDLWRPELERLEDEIAALLRDVAGHREVLSETRADLDQHRATLSELRATRERERGEARAVEGSLRGELAEHARVLASLTETHQRVLREARAQRQEMERQAAELVAHAGNLERERDAIRDQYSGLSSRFDDLHAELELGAEQSRELTQTLARSRQEGQWLVASLAERDERVDRLEARLRSRWDALLRLLWLRRRV